MITDILTPLDGTSAAEAGVEWSRRAAASLQATVRLLHIIDEDEASPSQREQAGIYLGRVRDSLTSDNVRAEIEVVAGRPADAIIERANRVDLTVMTSGTVRWMVSAVLDQVLQDVASPVVIVRAGAGNENSAACSDTPQKILVPIDSAEYSSDVLPIVRDLARGLDASIVLLHVIPPVGNYLTRDDAPPGIARVLDQLVAESSALGRRSAWALKSGSVHLETITEIGDPQRTIIRTAEATGASLIAMATRGRDRLDKRISGSVANTVMESTSIPCLFVRTADERVSQPALDLVPTDR